MADGSVTLQVIECGPDYVDCRIMNNASIGERKNMNLPGVKVELYFTSQKFTSILYVIILSYCFIIENVFYICFIG